MGAACARSNAGAFQVLRLAGPNVARGGAVAEGRYFGPGVDLGFGSVILVAVSTRDWMSRALFSTAAW